MFAAPEALPTMRLTRNEAVALVNTLHRLSMSVAAVGVMRDLEARTKLGDAALATGRWGAGLAGAAILALALRRLSRRREGGGKAAATAVQQSDAAGPADGLASAAEGAAAAATAASTSDGSSPPSSSGAAPQRRSKRQHA